MIKKLIDGEALVKWLQSWAGVNRELNEVIRQVQSGRFDVKEERIVPDMSILSEADHLLLKNLGFSYGTDFVVNALRHMEYLKSRNAIGTTE